METETKTVLVDASRAACLPTGYVLVSNAEGLSDNELADLAGFGSRHFGRTVTRHDDGSATVALWND